MDKKENAVKALEYLDNWLRVNKEVANTPEYPMYRYLNDLADRVDEMFEIYEDGKLSSISTNDYTVSFASSDEEAINAIQFLMDVAKKYQKIRLIINKWNAGIYDDEGLCDVEVLEMLSDEVLEDGNDD